MILQGFLTIFLEYVSVYAAIASKAFKIGKSLSILNILFYFLSGKYYFIKYKL